MNGAGRREGERLEFKRSWTDEALKDIAAFANRHGGTVLVGVDDDGTVVGFDADDSRLRELTSRVVD